MEAEKSKPDPLTGPSLSKQGKKFSSTTAAAVSRLSEVTGMVEVIEAMGIVDTDLRPMTVEAPEPGLAVGEDFSSILSSGICGGLLTHSPLNLESEC